MVKNYIKCKLCGEKPMEVSKMSEKEKKFWAVWRKDGHGMSTMRHTTETAALLEADRLVKQTGASFYVLKVIGIVEPAATPTTFTPIGYGVR